MSSSRNCAPTSNSGVPLELDHTARLDIRRLTGQLQESRGDLQAVTQESRVVDALALIRLQPRAFRPRPDLFGTQLIHAIRCGRWWIVYEVITDVHGDAALAILRQVIVYPRGFVIGL